MILLLLWLTVSIPFVYEAQQKLAKSTHNNLSGTGTQKDDTGNPFANTTEEKTPVSITEEYLHHEEVATNTQTEATPEYNTHRIATYIAFHGELISPPPDKA